MCSGRGSLEHAHQRRSASLLLATLFSTARRRNGYAALHDLATGTRVVERRVGGRGDRGRSRRRRSCRPARSSIVRGTFAVLDGAIDGWPGWRPWRRRAPAATGVDPRPAGRHAAGRRRRASRWRGRRGCAGWPDGGPTQEAWDVYEGVAGVPIAQACATPRTWFDGAALAGRPRARARGAAAGRSAAARSRSRLDPRLRAGQAARRSDRRRLARRQPAWRPGSACWSPWRGWRERTAQPWPLAASGFVDRLVTAPPASLADAAKAADALGRGRPAITRGLARPLDCGVRSPFRC